MKTPAELHLEKVCEAVSVQNEIILRNMLHQHGLIELLYRVRKENPGAQNPYHNTRHMEDVARTAVLLYRREIAERMAAGRDIPTPQMHDFFEKSLLIAGLMHDYGHSGGALPDRENIRVATQEVLALRDWFKEILILGLPQSLIAHVINLIENTEYPFVEDPITLPEQCLRDADLLGFLEPNGPSMVIDGLRVEMNTWGEPEKFLTPKAMYERQIQFVNNIKLFTYSAQCLWAGTSALQLERTRLLAEHYPDDKDT